MSNIAGELSKATVYCGYKIIFNNEVKLNIHDTWRETLAEYFANYKSPNTLFDFQDKNMCIYNCEQKAIYDMVHYNYFIEKLKQFVGQTYYLVWNNGYNLYHNSEIKNGIRYHHIVRNDVIFKSVCNIGADSTFNLESLDYELLDIVPTAIDNRGLTLREILLCIENADLQLSTEAKVAVMHCEFNTFYRTPSNIYHESEMPELKDFVKPENNIFYKVIYIDDIVIVTLDKQFHKQLIKQRMRTRGLLV